MNQLPPFHCSLSPLKLQMSGKCYYYCSVDTTVCNRFTTRYVLITTFTFSALLVILKIQYLLLVVSFALQPLCLGKENPRYPLHTYLYIQ
jgi:hypothetical protein